jgi:hypothetical protein
MMDEKAGRSADLASSERRTLYGAHGDQAKANAIVQGKQVEATGKENVATIKTKGAQTVEEIRAERIVTAEKIKADAGVVVANTYAMANRDKAELGAETDRAVAELNKQGKIEAARLLANAKGRIDPNVWMTATEDERRQLLEMAKTKQTEPPPADQASSAETVKPAGNAALAWAKANPNDPRAAAILKKLGVQ